MLGYFILSARLQSHCLYTFVMLSKIRLRCSACLIYCFLDLASNNETKGDETPEFPLDK